MKVLVTGAAGFVGAEVVRALLERGADVVTPLRATTDRRRLQSTAGRLRIHEIALEDVAAVNAMLAAEHPDVVIHPAWYAGPRDYRSSPLNLDSLAMTIRFAERVVAHECPRFVGVGSCLEYRPSNAPLTEGDPVAPEALYSVCKVAAWQILEQLTRGTSTEMVWARLFHVYGPGEASERLVPTVVSALRAGRSIELSPGLQVRDQIHVSDVGDALAHLALQPGPTGAVNVCSGVPVTLKELLSSVAAILGRPDLLRFDARPYLKDEVMHLVGDPARLRGSGWAPRWDLVRGLRHTLDPLA
jgi:dTDP-6-deoxy-L-talose 4-dehydrogenase (NAD+)